MSPDAVKFANEIASLVYTLIGIVATLLMVVIGAVGLWYEHRQMKKKLKGLEDDMAEADKIHARLEDDVNGATQAWNGKLLDFRHEMEEQRLAQAIRCGKHDGQVEVLKKQAEQTLEVLTTIQGDITWLRNQFIDMIREKKPGR